MIDLNIPGRGNLKIEYLVCDVNGTLAVDGTLIEGVRRPMALLRDRLTIVMLTANTYGSQALIETQLNLSTVQIQPGNEAAQKATYIRQLGTDRVAAIGQGANDALMLKEAGLGICILSPEGTAVEALLSADLVVPDIVTALGLFENPLRIVASLRR